MVEVTDRSVPRLAKSSTLIVDRTYYLPTYLHAKNNPDGESWLFLRRVFVWVIKSGHRQSRVDTEVKRYPDGKAMVNDIKEHPDWIEAPSEADGNPKWMPADLHRPGSGE